MQALVEFMRSAHGEHPLKAAGLIHHEFVAIHPFDDGNGRMARLLMNLVLMQEGYPPVVIKINEREAYFGALAQADKNEYWPLLTFLAQKLISSMELYLRGAKGESLEEIDDIDKKIHLLKQELNNVPEPKEFSETLFPWVLANHIEPLVEIVHRKLAQFDELFAEVRMQVIHTPITGVSVTSRLVNAKVQDVLALLKKPARSLHFSFTWDTFKKAGVNSFSVETSWHITCQRITLTVGGHGGGLKLLYSDPIGKSDASAFANSLAEQVLESIHKKRAKKAR
jgi:hypothetical protein